jgi:GAF domain-containing protein
MLAPVIVDGEMVATISVHHQGGPREWQVAEVRALADARRRLESEWSERRAGEPVAGVDETGEGT